MSYYHSKKQVDFTTYTKSLVSLINEIPYLNEDKDIKRNLQKLLSSVEKGPSSLRIPQQDERYIYEMIEIAEMSLAQSIAKALIRKEDVLGLIQLFKLSPPEDAIDLIQFKTEFADSMSTMFQDALMLDVNKLQTNIDSEKLVEAEVSAKLDAKIKQAFQKNKNELPLTEEIIQAFLQFYGDSITSYLQNDFRYLIEGDNKIVDIIFGMAKNGHLGANPGIFMTAYAMEFMRQLVKNEQNQNNLEFLDNLRQLTKKVNSVLSALNHPESQIRESDREFFINTLKNGIITYGTLETFKNIPLEFSETELKKFIMRRLQVLSDEENNPKQLEDLLEKIQSADFEKIGEAIFECIKNSDKNIGFFANKLSNAGKSVLLNINNTVLEKYAEQNEVNQKESRATGKLEEVSHTAPKFEEESHILNDDANNLSQQTPEQLVTNNNNLESAVPNIEEDIEEANTQPAISEEVHVLEKEDVKQFLMTQIQELSNEENNPKQLEDLLNIIQSADFEQIKKAISDCLKTNHNMFSDGLSFNCKQALVTIRNTAQEKYDSQNEAKPRPHDTPKYS